MSQPYRHRTINRSRTLSADKLSSTSKDYISLAIAATALLCLLFMSISESKAQTYQASPANWMYPAGNAASVRHVEQVSLQQSIDSMIVKWSTEAISGDVTPLIGNIINNQRLFDEFPFAPNEMTAVINNRIVIVDGGGRVRANQIDAEFIDRASVLIDPNQTGLSSDNRNILQIGLETIENVSEDTLAYAYLVGFDHSDTTAKVQQRMAINMRQYAPNVHASIRPFFGRQNGGDLSIYATINTNRPNIDAAVQGEILPEPIFLRGITQFDAENEVDNYPFSDIGDKAINRVPLLPQVNRGHISTANVNGQIISMLPSYPSPGYDFSLNNSITLFTIGNTAALMGFDLSGNDIGFGFDGLHINALFFPGSRPFLENYIVKLWNPTNNRFEDMILMAEQYSGIEGSIGTARLQLFDMDGNGLATSIPDSIPAIVGGNNHGWSVATGNIDGIGSNEQLPFFPNNPGDEIIVTQSTRDAAFPGSKIMVLKYSEIGTIPKPSPPNSTLLPFDTVFTQRLAGWVAAVNDLDGAPDGKDEILLADNSRIMVVRAKDYSDLQFRLGHRFDTLMVRDFGGETVSSAAIADMDGDGKNDIVVTTFERTYVIGAPLSSVLSFVYPDTDGDQICVGDTLELEWRNIIQSAAELDLAFIETDPTGIPLDTINLVQAVPNPDENVIYPYLVDTLVSGRTGVFVVFSPEAPDKVSAASAIVSIQASGAAFSMSAATGSGVNGEYYRIGDLVDFTTQALCVDSLGAEISIDGENWEVMGIDSVPAGSIDYTYTGEIPCIADAFDLSAPVLETEAYIRTVSRRNGFEFVSPADTILLRPKYLEVFVDTALSACTSKEILWTADSMPSSSDSLYIAVSLDDGATFEAVGLAGNADEMFVWHVPTDVPNSVPMRIVSYDGCAALDTVLGDVTPKYIDIVAPNPFNPYLSPASVIYEVPEETYVTIEIFSENDRLVATPVNFDLRQPGIAYCDKWDGLTYDQNLAQNGLYYIKMTMDIGITEIYPIFIHK